MNNDPNQLFGEKIQSNQNTNNQTKQIVVLDFWVIKFVFNSYRFVIYTFVNPS